MLQKASSSKLDKAMDPEQFDQIVDAILAGKYSWACILILRFAGYNPLHYMPYRTYIRVMKDNGPGKDSRPNHPQESSAISSSSTKISDLNYLEDVDQKRNKVHGGRKHLWFLPIRH